MTDARTQIHDFVARQRWFGGKGREFSVGGLTPVGLGLHLVDIAYAEGDTETWQLPLSSYAEPRADLARALVGAWADRHHYDAARDPEVSTAWLAAIAAESVVDDLTARRVAGQDVGADLEPTVFSGEQSNTSIAFGEESMLKVFRRVTSGINPDIEIHEALTRAGSTHVARLLGWLESAGTHLGLLQEFLRDAEEGWLLAVASVRDGSDFTGESRSLGVALAEVHATLREVMHTDSIPGTEIAARMRARLSGALEVAPDLARHADSLAALHHSLDELHVPAQRIHADLHLGQTLKTPDGWKLVDFEGEPARSLDERALPDSPWRDVAGMLRSFDYAEQVAARAQTQWAPAQSRAFLDGYQSATAEFTDQDRLLMRAFEVDKAVYEVTYEARNRPDWIDIPLSAIARTLEDSRG